MDRKPTNSTIPDRETDKMEDVTVGLTKLSTNGSVIIPVKQSATSLSLRQPTVSSSHTPLVFTMNGTTTSSSNGAGTNTSFAVGVAVGLAIAGVTLLLVCLAVAIFLIRRRRKRQRQKIVQIENPQYKKSLDDNSETKAVGIGPAGAVKYSSRRQNGSKKRHEAPLPPIYQPAADTGNRTWDSLTKRKAPPPPRNLGVELYEKDTPASSAENIKSVENMAAAPTAAAATVASSPVDDSKDLQTDKSHLEPLIAADSSAGSRKPASPQKDKDKQSPIYVPAAAAADIPAPTVPDSKAPVAEAEDDDDDLPLSDATTSLIGKKADSHISLDSYDRTKNPFFAD